MRRKRARSGGKEERKCPPLSPTYSLVGCEAEGAFAGFTTPTAPRPPRSMTKLLRVVTPRESQPSAGAAADPLGRRGAVVVGPAYGTVPSCARRLAGRPSHVSSHDRPRTGGGLEA